MTSVPPPVPESLPAGSSFHHRAANYAVLVLPASIAVNLLLGAVARAATAPGTKLALSLVPGVLMLSALPAGIVALCGIPKYGKRTLLWKGLVGVIVPILLTVMAVSAFRAVRRQAEARAAAATATQEGKSLEEKMQALDDYLAEGGTPEAEAIVTPVLTRRASEEFMARLPEARNLEVKARFVTERFAIVSIRYVLPENDAPRMQEIHFLFNSGQWKSFWMREDRPPSGPVSG